MELSFFTSFSTDRVAKLHYTIGQAPTLGRKGGEIGPGALALRVKVVVLRARLVMLPLRASNLTLRTCWDYPQGEFRAGLDLVLTMRGAILALRVKVVVLRARLSQVGQVTPQGIQLDPQDMLGLPSGQV